VKPYSPTDARAFGGTARDLRVEALNLVHR